MAFIERNGANLYDEVHGQGPALLLTHSDGASSRMWAGQIKMLSQDFQLILCDVCGHGRSDYPSGSQAYSQEATLADMAALFDLVNAPCAVIGGLSLGGYLSMDFYQVNSQRVRALLLIDTGPGCRGGQACETRNKNAIETAERFETQGLEARKPRELQADHRDAGALAAAARGLFFQRDALLIDSLSRITVPTLIVIGADNQPFLAPADYMAAKIPGAELKVIPNAGHFANLHNPAALDALSNFLQETGLALHTQG